MNVPCFEVTHLPALAGEAHFVSSGFQIGLIDKFRAAVSDHLVRPITDSCQGARTYPRKDARPIGDQDQIQRGLEQVPPLFPLSI